MNSSWGYECVCRPKGDGSICSRKTFAILPHSFVRTVQQGPEGRQNSTGVRKKQLEECVWCVCDPKTEREASHGKTNYSTSPLCLGEWRAGLIFTPKIQADKQRSSFVSTTHTHIHCSLIVNISVPGHLYSFLACAMSPLLSLVRWPMAGRTPFSSLDGRMVSRNIPLQGGKERFNKHRVLFFSKSNIRFQHTWIHLQKYHPANVVFRVSCVTWRWVGNRRGYECMAEIKSHPHMEIMESEPVTALTAK